MNIAFQDFYCLDHTNYINKIKQIIENSSMTHIWLDIDGVLLHSNKTSKSDIFHDLKRIATQYKKIKFFIITGRHVTLIQESLREDLVNTFNVQHNDFHCSCINHIAPNTTTMVLKKLQIICMHYISNTATCKTKLHESIIFIDDYFMPENAEHTAQAATINCKLIMCCNANLLTRKFHVYEIHKERHSAYVPRLIQTLDEVATKLYNKDVKLIHKDDWSVVYDHYHNLQARITDKGLKKIKHINFDMFTAVYNQYPCRLVINNNVQFIMYTELINLINNLSNTDMFEILFEFCKMHNLAQSRDILKIKIKEIFVDGIMHNNNTMKSVLFLTIFLGQTNSKPQQLHMKAELRDFYRMLMLSLNNNMFIQDIYNYENMCFTYTNQCYDTYDFHVNAVIVGTSPLFLLMLLTAIILTQQHKHTHNIHVVRINNTNVKILIETNKYGAVENCMFIQ